MRRFVLIVFAASVAGCGPTERVCTMEARAGVSVLVFDSSNVRVCTAFVVAKAGDSEETLAIMPGQDAADCTHVGLWERSGTFTITATSARFAGQLSEPLTIASDGCHVIGQTLELRAP